MLCTPLLLLCAPLYASAAAIAALPLRRLRAELGDEPHAARARFERADVDGVGRLNLTELYRLSSSVPPRSSLADAVALRGVEIALCPLGGSSVTQASLETWLREGTALGGGGGGGGGGGSGGGLAEGGTSLKSVGVARETSEDEPGWLLEASASLGHVLKEEGAASTSGVVTAVATPGQLIGTSRAEEAGSKPGGEEEEASPPALQPTCYGAPWPEATTQPPPSAAGLTSDTLPIWLHHLHSVLVLGPPAGGWRAQPSSALLAASAGGLAVGALLALLVALGSALYGDVSLLITELIPSLAVLAVALAAAAIELSLLAPPLSAVSRPAALPLLRAVPPLSLGLPRAFCLLVGAAALWRALPEGSLLSATLALCSAGLAIAAGGLNWKVCYALAYGVDAHVGEGAVLARLLGSSNQSAAHQSAAAAASAYDAEAPAGESDLRVDELRRLLASVDCADAALEGCISLDLDRDGAVGEDDVARFYGGRASLELL